MSDDYNQAAFEWIVAMRGGLPEKCDFCGQPFTQERYPIPEEGGEWACNACYIRWGHHPAPTEAFRPMRRTERGPRRAICRRGGSE